MRKLELLLETVCVESIVSEAPFDMVSTNDAQRVIAYLRSFRPLGYQSRDMGLFKDDDGTGYLLTEDVRPLYS